MDQGKPSPPHHYNQKPLRKAEFVMPLNSLKSKVGTGGLSEAILNKAEALLENNVVDFMPLADMYLNALLKGIEAARKADMEQKKTGDGEALISAMLYPAMQLKANGGMFRYQLVTQMSERLIEFLEVIDNTDTEALEIVLAFHATIRAVVLGRIMGDGGRHGVELMRALEEACVRYFEHYPNTKPDLDLSYIHKVD
jgi:hypothetical protein